MQTELQLLQSVPVPPHIAVRRARAATLAVKGVKLFNSMPAQLRNSEHGDVLMFKNHLDIYLQGIPD